jgi:manganese oxidase
MISGKLVPSTYSINRVCSASVAILSVASRVICCTTIAMLGLLIFRESRAAVPVCERTITASVVALEQVYTYNRFGAFNPAGMMFALRRDVVVANEDSEEIRKLRIKENEQIPQTHNANQDKLLSGNVRLRPDKRPRPLVLRINEGDCLQVTFTNLLSHTTNGQEVYNEPLARLRPDEGDVKEDVAKQRQAMPLDSEEPRTRHASMHVNGLDYVGGVCPGGSVRPICADGANVGNNPSSLAAPGQTATSTWYAKKEGGYLLYSMGAPAGGEGDGGQLGLGLFGSVNVEPRGAIAYRSQVTHDELEVAIDRNKANNGRNPNGTPIVNYAAVYPSGAKHHGDPVLSVLKPIPSSTNKCTKAKPCEIVYSDLNAVVDLPRNKAWTEKEWKNHYGCSATEAGSSCGESFREFTSIFHDEVTAVQAFRELEDETNSLNRVKDGMAINYGAAGMGSAVLASRKGIGPAAHCAECKLEEFFLSSWANGDPAMLVERDPTNTLKAVNALYPDDPSNVHHSYIGDAVRFRNLHAGPKETHVFHLHAHQWVRNDGDENSTYLDSQTVSPGASFSYQIYYGGSGNRNLTPGDSIFHCHLYPHFAQGMWELWRSHDVFEAGTELDSHGGPKFTSRALPDGEITQGTPIPAVLPVPGLSMPPLPTAQFKGYPFYIAGQPGHRPPQPPHDLVVENGEHLDGGLPRHRILDGSVVDGKDAVDDIYMKDLTNEDDLYNKGRKTVNENAKRVRTTSGQPELFDFARKLDSARIELLPLAGTPEEKKAMEFHEAPGRPTVTTKHGWQARSYDSYDSSGTPKAFLVNGKSAKPGAPYADPCPIGQPLRTYKTAYIQFDMTVNKAGWHDPQARIAVLQEDVKSTLDKVNPRPPEPLFIRANSDECVVFEATNLVPSALNVDDFQLFSPTDIIGQHIHLVKFDVTSSDGSANGWNYEDGTYSPDEVRERIDANNKYQTSFGGTQILKPKAQAFFSGDKFSQAKCGTRDAQGKLLPGQEDGPWCGAQTTAQRWWADPLLNSKGEDRTLRTVFTHDHFGPSSHQHHGLYAALVIEPKQSEWQKLDGTPFGGISNGSQLIKRADGGPTSYAANIVLPTPNEDKSRREFNLAFADFAIVYDADNKPISGPEKMERDLPIGALHPTQPRPESISAGDPGTQLLNYRNEPIPLRIGKPNGTGFVQKTLSDKDPQCEPLEREPERLNAIIEDKCARGDNDCINRFINSTCDPGDLANVFSSRTHVGQSSVQAFKPSDEPAGVRLSGDPATPLLTAYQGDRVQLRLVQGGQEENHVFTMHGVKWLSQPESPNSGYMNAQHIGISEHFEFDVKLTPENRATDYLYSSSATDNLWDGMWGILRAYPSDDKEHSSVLGDLPSNHARAKGAQRAPDKCPSSAPERRFDVSAWRLADLVKAKKVSGASGALAYSARFGISDPGAIVFVKENEEVRLKGETIYEQPLGSDLKALAAGRVEPLILRAAAGDCIRVFLTNNLPAGVDGMKDGAEHEISWSWNMVPPIVEGFNFNQIATSNRVSLHPQLLSAFPVFDDGANVGFNRDSTVMPGEKKHEYVWYAGDDVLNSEGVQLESPIEFGVTALRDMADVIKHTSHGAIGALVVEPKGTLLTKPNQAGYLSKHPEIGKAAENFNKHHCGPDSTSQASANICDANGSLLFREFVLLYQDDLALRQGSYPAATDAMANLRNGDDAEDSGQKAFNYRTEPLWGRLGAGGPATGPEAMMQYDFSKAFSSKLDARGKCEFDGISTPPCDPETPLFAAKAGTPIRVRVVHPGGHPRNHAFTLFGHNWESLPWTEDSTVIGHNPNSDVVGSASGIGSARHVNIVTKAGGEFAVPGDYMYRTQEGFMFGGGLWGILRVECEHGEASCSQAATESTGQKRVSHKRKAKASASKLGKRSKS